MQPMPNNFTIKQLSNIFKTSPKCVIRYLKAFNVPVKPVRRKRTIITSANILNNNPSLHTSIHLAILNKIEKPFFTIKDLAKKFGKSHSGMYVWLKRNEIPMLKCGNKLVLLAYDLLNIGDNQTNLRHFKQK